MATTTNTKVTLHQRAMHELKELVILAVYLYITLGAVILMKTAVLNTEGIAVVKAAVLAKFMLLGNAMKIGGRNTTSPLIWPTLHKAFAFLVLLIVMTTIEEAVVGLFLHRSIASSLSEALGEGRLERIFFVEWESVERRQGILDAPKPPVPALGQSAAAALQSTNATILSGEVRQ